MGCTVHGVERVGHDWVTLTLLAHRHSAFINGLIFTSIISSFSKDLFKILTFFSPQSFSTLFCFWPLHVALGILVPWSGIKPMYPAMEAWSLKHWIAREIPPHICIISNIRRWLLLGRRAMTNLDCVLKSCISQPTKVHIVKAMAFPLVAYGFESWTVKRVEHGRIDAFELWCWRRLLRVPWTARRSSQSILREINPKYVLKGLMLKLQYFGHLMGTAYSLEKSLMLGKIEGSRRRGQQRMSWPDGITDAMDMNIGKLQEMVRDREAWRAIVHRVTKSWHNWATEQQHADLTSQ